MAERLNELKQIYKIPFLTGSENKDLNNIADGFYTFENSVLNIPVKHGGFVLQLKWQANWKWQIVIIQDNSIPQMYIRLLPDNDTWGDWYEFKLEQITQ